MKTFLLRLGIFILGTVFLVFIFLVSRTFDKGRVDAFYNRFTTEKQESLVLGSSRAAQGLDPSLWPEKIFNYSFTIGTSKYGPVYYRAIREKLKENSSGIVIMELNPLSISYEFEENSNEDPSKFIEEGRLLTNLHFFNLDPNLDYLINCYEDLYYKLLLPDKSSGLYLHENGWLEIEAAYNMTEAGREVNIKNKLKAYSRKFEKQKISQIRLNWLHRTVDLLKNKRIYLVRWPVHPEMKVLEDEYMPDFDTRMQVFSSEKGIDYIDFASHSGDYLTTDGNHLMPDEARKFTKALSMQIYGME